MKAAILCPGPSLMGLDAVPPADIVIGVNRAAVRFVCGFWSVLDYQTMREVTPVGSPRIFTSRVSATELGLNGSTLIVEDIETPPRTTTGWSLFSATAAIALAYHLGARRIEVYGADMSGTDDYDGCQGCGRKPNRTPDRWTTERGIIHKLNQWITANGGELVGVTI